MLLKYFYDKMLAQASYMVGCSETGEALVIDLTGDGKTVLRAGAGIFFAGTPALLLNQVFNSSGNITQNWSSHTRDYATATAQVEWEDYTVF